jgi:hypothetical protein
MGDQIPIPTIGRIVIYRSRTGDYDIPAIVTATQDTLNLKGVEAGYVPPLSGDYSVHLTVFSPGKGGLHKEAENFLVKSEYPVSENVSGCYQEWDISIAIANTIGPGTWRWPERVGA